LKFLCEILRVYVTIPYLHLNAKWHLIIFKCDEVIDVLVRPLSDFRALKKRLRRNTAKQRH